MATKTKLRIEQGRFPSSPERRAAAKQRADELKAEELRLREEIKAVKDTVGPMVEMAQFVVDVDGDPTAVARLREALEAHKAAVAKRERLTVVLKALNNARSEAMYYRWKAGEVESMCGLGMFVVLGEGDTKAAALAKAKSRNR